MASVLVPPAAWSASLGLSYLIEDFTCRAAASAGVADPGGTVLTILLTGNVVLLLLTVAAGVLGWRLWRRAADRTSRWMGGLAAVLTVFFGLGIVLITSNLLVLEVCGP